ncbi:hypothetical protein [Methylocella sp. CPCC 101449]|uniref:hypothetical protein n=1 Tax=Methylocella sp. CPCC 101449 TaxID=2987531 RepID=UPI00288DAF14|nr:hypothetical protein [Methylocella sp. CPCC 101449]MDT2019951.1 hypothetical protein [Methylocella sp. CPCC 101449]
MFRFFLRTIGVLLLAGGCAMLIIDGTQSIAASQLKMTPLGETCFKLFPTIFPLLQPAVERNIHPLVWDPFLLGFFLMPTWLALSLFGLLFFWVARRRAEAIGFSSRP